MRNWKWFQSAWFGDRRDVVGVDPAAALAGVLYAQRGWQLRKVERKEFMEGRYLVTKVSVDCVPQDLPGLRYALPDQDRVSGTQDLLMVPITMLRKGTLKAFDMRGPGGEPVSVIGRSEYSNYMVDALIFEIDDAVSPGATAVLRTALHCVLDGDPGKGDENGKAERVATTLVVDGTYQGIPVLDPDRLSDYVVTLILDLSVRYVLIALVPGDFAGRRTVLKYTHHSELEFKGAGPWQRLLIASGLVTLPYAFQLGHPEGTASHHLEVAIPERIACSRLTMPALVHDRNTVDEDVRGVAHAVGRYEDEPFEYAVAELRVPLRGLRGTASLVCLLTAVIVALGLWLPGAQNALFQASDGAAALLLAIPAVAVALGVGRRESALVSYMLLPLRVIIIGCSLLLLACAGSIVGILNEPWREWLWTASFAVSGVLFVMLRLRGRSADVGARVHTATSDRLSDGGVENGAVS